MPFLTPKQLIEQPEDALRDFLKASIQELRAALPQYEAIKGGDKRLYILPLIKNASYQQLLALYLKSSKLNAEPEERSFLYRLNDAIVLKTMIMEFDNENYKHLEIFINFNGDKLREFAEIIIDVKQSTADLLMVEVVNSYPSKLYELNRKLQTIVGADVDASTIPILKYHSKSFPAPKVKTTSMYPPRSALFSPLPVKVAKPDPEEPNAKVTPI